MGEAVSALDSMLRALRALVREEIAIALGANGLVFSTEPCSWPPGVRSRRGARQRIRAVAGHVRTGAGRATIWSVGVEAYQAHHSRSASAVRIVPEPVSDDDAIAEAALDAAGLRSTRRAS